MNFMLSFVSVAALLVCLITLVYGGVTGHYKESGDLALVCLVCMLLADVAIIQRKLKNV